MCREKRMMIPELFLCPISLDLMSDPVTLLATGHTYDRRNIQRWLAGRRTCPVTMHTLPDKSELAPNRTLKHLIDRWLLTGRTLSVSDLALPTLTDNLTEEQDDTAVLEETLRIVRCLSPPGLCASLLVLLLRAPPSPAPVLELALDCLVASPSKHELATALQQEEEHKTKKIMPLIAFQLRQGSSVKVKTGLCRLIQILGSAGAHLLLGRSEQVMGALGAALVLHADNDAAVSSAALRAMWSLIRLPDEATRETAVAAGAVDALLSYISSGHKTKKKNLLLPLALETLELLLTSVDAARQAMYARSGAGGSGTATLVRMVFRVPSDGGSEHAIGSLLVTCRESGIVRVDAINAGLLEQLLLLLQTQCSPKAKTNARALLKLLRALWARH